MTADIDAREIKDFLIYLHLKIMSHEEIATGKGLSAMMTLRSRYPQFGDIKSENEKIFEWLDKEKERKKKTIDFQILSKISKCFSDIFRENSQIYPNEQKIRSDKKDIERYYKQINADEKMKKDIEETSLGFDEKCERQCRMLKQRGYEIINNEEELE